MAQILTITCRKLIALLKNMTDKDEDFKSLVWLVGLSFPSHFLNSTNLRNHYQLLLEDYHPHLKWNDILDIPKPKENNEIIKENIELVIDTFPTYILNWEYLSQLSCITYDIVSKNLDKPWNYAWLFSRDEVLFGFVKANLEKLEADNDLSNTS